MKLEKFVGQKCMNKNILNTEIQNYIHANLDKDLHSLLLKKSPFPEVSMLEIVQQIKGRKVAVKKFPFLLKEGIVFPPNLNLEQASSEATSRYKMALVKGRVMVDLTSGFGIDAFFISQNFKHTFLVEQNALLSEIVQHNWEILNRKATFKNESLEDFLKENHQEYHLFYLDPARRDENQNKVFLLEDLSPNLIEIQDVLLRKSQKVLVKLSPLIDLSYLVSTLKNIVEIHIVAVKNDVKEVLVLMDSSPSSKEIVVRCVNLETSEPAFEFSFDEISNAEAHFSEPQNYLYIANNSVLKSGAFNLIGKKYHLQKLHPNTHLYTSNSFIEEFPGRILKVETIDGKQLKKNQQYNIICKNYPLKPEAVKKKYGLKDGGIQYVIFTQSKKGKIILKSIEN